MFCRCQDQSTGTLLGGEDVKQAVIAVFTALLWHTQTLREDVDKLGKDDYYHCLCFYGVCYLEIKVLRYLTIYMYVWFLL